MKKILWIDDDLYGTMMYFAREMEFRGYLIERATSVEECAKLLEDYGKPTHARERPDAIILDMIMPWPSDPIPDWMREAIGESDFDNARQTGVLLLRRLETVLKGVPIIVLTHLQETSAVGRKVFDLLKADARVYKPILQKPKTAREIIAAIEAAGQAK